MIDRKLFQKTFSTLHASPDTLSEVYKVVRKERKHRHSISRGVLIAAVLAMCITVAGAAVGVAQLIKANVAPAERVTTADLHATSACTAPASPAVVIIPRSHLIQASPFSQNALRRAVRLCAIKFFLFIYYTTFCPILQEQRGLYACTAPSV